MSLAFVSVLSLVYAYLCTLHLHALLFALFIIVTALLGVIFSIMLTTLYTHTTGYTLLSSLLAFGSSMLYEALAAFGKFR